ATRAFALCARKDSPRRAASSSRTSCPTLCRVSSYRGPGLPSPTISHASAMSLPFRRRSPPPRLSGTGFDGCCGESLLGLGLLGALGLLGLLCGDLGVGCGDLVLRGQR